MIIVTFVDILIVNFAIGTNIFVIILYFFFFLLYLETNEKKNKKYFFLYKRLVYYYNSLQVLFFDAIFKYVLDSYILVLTIDADKIYFLE